MPRRQVKQSDHPRRQPRKLSPLPRGLYENSNSLSFRGGAGEEESRTALNNIQSEIPRCARNDSFEAFAQTPR